MPSGPTGLTLTITDDETAPTVTLKLDPTSISEDGGGESTVTATLDRATSETVTLTVSATAVSPAVPGDFELSANQVPTITAGQTSSTGTVTITAEDNDVDAPAKELTVSAAVTSGPTGLTVPASQTLTITENGGVSTVTASLNGLSSADVGRDRIRVGGRSGGCERLHAERQSGADHRSRADGEHGDGDGHRRQQRRRRTEQDRRGDGVGDGRQRRDGAGGPDADDHRRRSAAGGDAGARSGVHRRERRCQYGDGASLTRSPWSTA